MSTIGLTQNKFSYLIKMQLKLEKKEDKPLTERQEIVLKILNPSTPSNAQVKEKIAELMKCSQDLVVIKKIDQMYGKQETVVTAHVYKNTDALDTFEPKTKGKKEEGKKEEKQEAKVEKPAEKPAEKPEAKPEKVEEKKEEAKEEVKKEAKQ